MFECFSQPNVAYIIMAIDESEEAYNHVVGVLLDAAIDSPIDLTCMSTTALPSPG